MPMMLDSTLFFPPLHRRTSCGLLAVGGDLSVKRLILTYSQGIFPWYSDDSPILWWSPPLRCILPLRTCTSYDYRNVGLRVSRRLNRKYKNQTFRHSINEAFSDVISYCATVPRFGQNGTWLTQHMQQAYINLHNAGFAHSIECWQNEKLVGGLYGVAIGKAFFGESMFHLISDASKMALMTLVKKLEQHNFQLLDCQQDTPHILRMGAEILTREQFMKLLDHSLDSEQLSSLARAELQRKSLAEKKLPLFLS